VLYHLDSLSALLGIGIALVAGLLVHDAAQVLAARALGDPTPLRSGRLTWRLPPHVEVFGAVAAVIVGYGWGAPVPMAERWRARRWRLAGALLAGPVSYVILAVLGVVALRASLGHGTLVPNACLFAAATWCALTVVSLVPLWPLDGGRIMFALAPPTLGWQKARYQMEERNIGIAVALALALLPRLFTGLPDPVGQLADDLLKGLNSLAGPALLAGADFRALFR
jgi:Zn-dependent protease